jgi:uncharacterized protein DUF4124
MRKPLFYHARLSFALLCLAPLLTPHAGASKIFECKDASGHRTFSDRGCPNPQPYTPDLAPVIKFEKIDPRDAARLAAAQKNHRQQTLERRKRKHMHYERHRQAQQQREIRCADARTELKRLQDQRRQGYRISEQAKLDAAQARYRKLKQQNC